MQQDKDAEYLPLDSNCCHSIEHSHMSSWYYICDRLPAWLQRSHLETVFKYLHRCKLTYSAAKGTFYCGRIRFLTLFLRCFKSNHFLTVISLMNESGIAHNLMFGELQRWRFLGHFWREMNSKSSISELQSKKILTIKRFSSLSCDKKCVIIRQTRNLSEVRQLLPAFHYLKNWREMIHEWSVFTHRICCTSAPVLF